MTRLTIGLLVAAVAGGLGWWSSTRNGNVPSTALAQNNTQPTTDDRMIKQPSGDIDPNMIKQMPDVDPKMIRQPPWPRGTTNDTSNGRINISDETMENNR